MSIFYKNNIYNPAHYPTVSSEQLWQLRQSLMSLVGVQLPVLRLPVGALLGFEPSQIGTIVGTLMDACIPQSASILPENDLLSEIGLSKHEGILGDREGYPDYRHISGLRVELKLLYVDPIGLQMKSPPTLREASARLTQKVTLKNVDPAHDVLMVLAYQLGVNRYEPQIVSPTIIDIGLFPVIDCILARDKRLTERGGKWFGDYETPAVLSKSGKLKKKCGLPIDDSQYGRKASEGKDFNEDTNFGKLKRIPFKPLQEFLKKHGATYASAGTYPEPWVIDGVDPSLINVLLAEETGDENNA
jgi:hypothetical protein